MSEAWRCECGARNLPSAHICTACRRKRPAIEDVEGKRSVESEERRQGTTPDIPGFSIEARLGRGGTGSVWRARDEQGTLVAIKVLSPELFRRQKARARFLLEAELLGRVDHPNVVRVLSHGQTTKHAYLVMDFLVAQDLRAIEARRLDSEHGLIPIETIVDVVRQLAGALDAAHEAGVLHRDIKLENVLLDQYGHVTLVDFGFGQAPTDAPETPLTETGFLCGTPHYIAPEYAIGAPASVQTEVYALGCLLYRLLTGKFPYDGKSTMEVLQGHVKKPVPLVHEHVTRSIPMELSKATWRAMNKKGSARFQSAGALGNALDTPVKKPLSMRFSPWLALAVVLFAVIVALLWAALQ